MDRPYKILINFMTSTGCDAYRSFLPFRHCHRALAEEGIILDLKFELNHEEKYDAYVFHRHMSADFIPILYAIKMSKAKIVWDLDDNLFEIPKSNPAHTGFGIAGYNSLTMYLAWSDYVTCSTLPLANQLIETYHVDPNRLAILPNLIDANDWPTPKPNPLGDVKKILWSGSASHQEDLEQIVEPINQIIKERDDVQFVFVGMMPKDLMIHIPERCAWFYGSEVKYYSQLLCMIRPDISLAPLVPGRFNEAKSGIKWMEGTLAGASSVVSDIAPYSDVVRHCETGMICDKDSWHETITGLLDHPERNYLLRDNARKDVIEKYSWRSGDFEKWMAFFRHVAHSSQAEQASIVA